LKQNNRNLFFTPNFVQQAGLAAALFAFLLVLGFQTDKASARTALETALLGHIQTAATAPRTAAVALEKLAEQAESKLDAQDTLLGNIYANLAKIYLDNNFQLERALQFNRQTLAIRRAKLPPNSPKIAQSLHNTSIVLRRRGRHTEAKTLILEAIDIKQQRGDSTSLMRSYNELAEIGMARAAYFEAREAADRVVEIAQQTGDSFSLAAVYITRGNSFFLQDNFSEAQTNYSAALQLFDKQNSAQSAPLLALERANCQTNLGICARKKGDFKSARQQLLSAEKAYRTFLKDTISLELGNCLAELGHLDAETQNAPRAIEMYKQAIKTFGNLCHPLVVECWTSWGDLSLKQKNTAAALAHYQTAISLVHPNFQSTDVASNPNLLAANFSRELLDVYLKKANLQLSLSGNVDEIGLKNAFLSFQKCDTIVRVLRESYENDASKYWLSAQTQPLYEHAMRTCYQLFERTKDNFWADQALGFAENSRAAVLLEALRQKRAQNSGGVPDSLKNIETDFRGEIAFLEKQIFDASSDALREEFQKQLFDQKQAFGRFKRGLETQYPKYFSLKYAETRPLTLAEMQNGLTPETLVLEYALGDSALYIWAVSAQSTRFFEKKFAKDEVSSSAENLTERAFQALFKNLKRSLSDDRYLTDSLATAEKQYLQAAHVLYNFLLKQPLAELAPAGSDINRLRIVTDGILGYLPFDLLLEKPEKTWLKTDISYLIQRFAVSYVYSNRLLKAASDAPQNSELYGGFGIEYDDVLKKNISNLDTLNDNWRQSQTPTSATRNGSLARLAFAPIEVANIHRLLQSGHIWLNEKATKAQFLETAPRCGILHLAMHGALDEKNPLNSGLVFSRNDTTTDNYLSGYDLCSMQLKTGLAVLSACNTGNGELRRGEGIMSLARAFAYAGCPSVMMSLWSIPDESTSKVVFNFYENLKNGDEKDRALQKSKLLYLKNCPPQYAIPNYWAAMVIIGDVRNVECATSGITFQNFYKKGSFWAIFALLAALILLFLRYKK
jgi:CHAT domain-containing protein